MAESSLAIKRTHLRGEIACDAWRADGFLRFQADALLGVAVSAAPNGQQQQAPRQELGPNMTQQGKAMP